MKIIKKYIAESRGDINFGKPSKKKTGVYIVQIQYKGINEKKKPYIK